MNVSRTLALGPRAHPEGPGRPPGHRGTDCPPVPRSSSDPAQIQLPGPESLIHSSNPIQIQFRSASTKCSKHWTTFLRVARVLLCFCEFGDTSCFTLSGFCVAREFFSVLYVWPMDLVWPENYYQVFRVAPLFCHMPMDIGSCLQYFSCSVVMPSLQI